MPNILKLTVENPDEIRNAGAYDTGALMRLQTSSTEGGAYADVSGTGSTPTIAVVAGTRIYTGYDPNGTSSSWYRTRFENAGASRLSDWSAAFQVGDETGYLLCSLYDVQQELDDTTGDNERILEVIRQVSAAIEGYTGRWFAPRPLSGTATKLMDSRYGMTLYVPKGIRSAGTLGYAVQDQPSSGGSYTTIASTGYVLEPTELERDYGWPPTRVQLLTSAGTCFYDAVNGVQFTDGMFGWAAVPYDIQGVAIRAAVRRYFGKAGSGAIAIGPSGIEMLLPDLSGSDRAVLDFYRHWPA